MSIRSIISRESAVNVLFFVATAALFVVAANVATAEPHRGGSERHFERMADELSLSDAQRQQFKQIYRDARSEKLALHDAMQDNREAMHRLDPSAKDYGQQVEKLAAEKGDLVRRLTIHKSQVRAQVHAILTPEQRQLARELKKQRRGGGEQRERGERRCRR